MNWWVVIFSWLIKCLSDSECFSIRNIVTWIWKVPALYSVQLSTIVIHQRAPARFFYFVFVPVYFCILLYFCILYFVFCPIGLDCYSPDGSCVFFSSLKDNILQSVWLTCKKKRQSVIILLETDYIRLFMDQTVICY